MCVHPGVVVLRVHGLSTTVCIRSVPQECPPSLSVPSLQVQETIVSTLGKGGNHAFITIRADLAENTSDLESDQGWPSWQSDWLGVVLPTRATDLRGERRENDRQEASSFLVYLRHQRDWLRAIEQARSPSVGDSEHPESQGAATSEGVEEVVLAVEAAIRESGGGAEEVGTAQPLVTAKRWRRSAG